MFPGDPGAEVSRGQNVMNRKKNRLRAKKITTNDAAQTEKVFSYFFWGYFRGGWLRFRGRPVVAM